MTHLIHFKFKHIFVENLNPSLLGQLQQKVIPFDQMLYSYQAFKAIMRPLPLSMTVALILTYVCDRNFGRVVDIWVMNE